MSGTILVTGGTIGDFVVDGLTKKGKKVRVTTYKNQSKAAWAAAGIEQAEFYYTRPETLARAFEGVESYFSVSPLIRELSEAGIEAVNAAKKAGIRRIVRSSALGAASNSVTFGRWHFAVDRRSRRADFLTQSFSPMLSCKTISVMPIRSRSRENSTLLLPIPKCRWWTRVISLMPPSWSLPNPATNLRNTKSP
jgi:hypothetical protein